MNPSLMHFHCPACHPQLVRGTTPAICGAVIQPLTVSNARVRKCPDCKSARRTHEASHRR